MLVSLETNQIKPATHVSLSVSLSTRGRPLLSQAGRRPQRAARQRFQQPEREFPALGGGEGAQSGVAGDEVAEAAGGGGLAVVSCFVSFFWGWGGGGLGFWAVVSWFWLYFFIYFFWGGGGGGLGFWAVVSWLLLLFIFLGEGEGGWGLGDLDGCELVFVFVFFVF